MDTIIPEPAISTSDGLQEVETGILTAKSSTSKFDQPPLLQEMRGVVTVNPTVLGGPLGQAMAIGSSAQFAMEANEAKQELRGCRKDLEQERALRYQCSNERDLLAQRLSESNKSRTLRELSIFIGTALLGIAVDKRTSETSLAITLVIFGLALLTFGWLSGRFGAKQ